MRSTARAVVHRPMHHTIKRVQLSAVSHPRARAVRAQAASAGKPLDAARQQLQQLEDERDEAVSNAEAAARAAMKLSDMVELLEELALKKVKQGDEDGARQVLQEKVSAKEVLERTSDKAQLNYTLAAKLADKIGEKQKEVLGLLGPTAELGASSVQGSGADSAASKPPPTSASSTATRSSSGSSSTAASSSSSSSSSAGGYTPMKPKWQESLEEAKRRIEEAESEAQAAGRRVRSLGAEASIMEAQERLRAQTSEDILSAKARLRQGAEESIKEAQERLRQQDKEVLAYVNRIMARYRRGEYVAEEELEFAFQQLERRFTM